MDKLTIRTACEADFASLFEIEQEAFTHPWPLEGFTDFLLPWAWILMFGKKIAGYIFYHGVGDEMVIINFAIRPCYQEMGWGEFLLKESLQKMIANGVRRFYLDVRISNIKARNLYEKFGFRALGTRKNYYTNPDEDAIVMEKQIHD